MPRYADVDKMMKHAVNMEWSTLKWVNEVDICDCITSNIVKRKTGKWIPFNPDEKGFANHIQCSECSAWQKMEVPHKTHDFDFCPSCGVYMREESDSG